MNKREVIQRVLAGGQPPYVPWSFGFTQEAREQLKAHYGAVELEDALQNHLLKLGSEIGVFTGLGDCVQDVFGVVWDRSIDKDIGNVKGCVLSQPTLHGYSFLTPGRAFLRRYPRQDCPVWGSIPPVPDRFFAVRACLDVAACKTC
jgi:uroporphyrinogen decarboxylase